MMVDHMKVGKGRSRPKKKWIGSNRGSNRGDGQSACMQGCPYDVGLGADELDPRL